VSDPRIQAKIEIRNRELEEEVGITDAVYDEQEVNRFSWQKKGLDSCRNCLFCSNTN
jgi:hypothetical protein